MREEKAWYLDKRIERALSQMNHMIEWNSSIQKYKIKARVSLRERINSGTRLDRWI